MKIFLARFAIKSRVVRYMKKNQMVMKKIVSIILIVLAAVLFTSCRSLTYRAHRLEHKALRTNDEVEKRRYLAAADWCHTLDSVNKVAEPFNNDTLYLTALRCIKRSDGVYYDIRRVKSTDYTHSFETPYRPYYNGVARDVDFCWGGDAFRVIAHTLDGQIFVIN